MTTIPVRLFHGALLALGLALALFQAPSAQAETIAATHLTGLPAQRWFSTYGYSGGWDADAACQAIVKAFYGSAFSGVSASGISLPRTVRCQGSYYGGPVAQATSFSHYWMCQTDNPSGAWGGAMFWDQDNNPNSCGAYTCPPGQNWTLSGTNCTRPNCTASETRMTNGVCCNTTTNDILVIGGTQACMPKCAAGQIRNAGSPLARPDLAEGACYSPCNNGTSWSSPSSSCICPL